MNISHCCRSQQVAIEPGKTPFKEPVNRREFLGITTGAGALALTPEWLRAFQQSRDGTLIQRAIPSSGEMLPAVGLSFSNHPGCADHAALKEVLRTYADNGGRVFDAMHVSAAATEQFHITVADELGIQNKLFWSMRGIPGGAPPQPGAVKTAVDSLLARIKVPRLDLVMLPARCNEQDDNSEYEEILPTSPP